MTRTLLTRSLRVLLLAALTSGSSVATVRAEPIRVTSGVFVIDDDPTFFLFSGADGFDLRAIFVNVPISPRVTCEFVVRGCAPGTVINLSAVAGGTSLLINSPFTLGTSFIANVNGTPFFPSPRPQGRLAGTLRFDAPSFVLPAVPQGATTGPGFTAPFVFSGQVRGFAPEDIELRNPLFDVELVGQGTVGLGFDTVFNGLFSTVEERFTFTATPEPASLLLLSSALLGLAAREWDRRSRSVLRHAS